MGPYLDSVIHFILLFTAIVASEQSLEAGTNSAHQPQSKSSPQSAFVREASPPIPSPHLSVSEALPDKPPQAHRSRVREESKAHPATPISHVAGAKRHIDIAVDSLGEVETLPEQSESLSNVVTAEAHKVNLAVTEPADRVPGESEEGSRKVLPSSESSSLSASVSESGPGAHCIIAASLIAAKPQGASSDKQLAVSTSIDGVVACAGAELEHGASCRPNCARDFAFTPRLKDVGCGPTVQHVVCLNGQLSASAAECICSPRLTGRYASDFVRWASGWIGSSASTNLHLAR